MHCCSQWGHDFRSDYQFLNILKRQFKNVPILGLTATATTSVLEDVKSILGLHGIIYLKFLLIYFKIIVNFLHFNNKLIFII